jgi:arylsulfatase A-like enzyme
MKNRRCLILTYIIIIGCILATTSPVFALDEELGKKYNVLFLMSDQHGPDAIGYYGDQNALTPNLNRLALSGFSLRQAYCQSPVCVSSRNAILNGLYSHSNGVISNAFSGNTNMLSFPQVLRHNGYRTACFGKLHTPGREHLDWDVYIDDRERSRSDMPEGSVVLAGTANLINDPTIGAPDHFPRTTTYEWRAKENTIQFMRENQDKPWMIQCSMHKPHPPFQPPLEYWDKIDRSQLKIPGFPENDLEDCDPRYKRIMNGRGMWDMSREHILDGMQGYYGNLAFVDDMFGEVLDELDRLGLRENTLVVYVADHGEMLHQHGLWFKFVFFDASVRVPLILSFPGIIEEGEESDALVELIDLFPTIMELTGCETPDIVQGRSLISILTGKTRRHRKVVHSEFPLPGMNEPGGEYHATMMLFDGRYKLIDNGPDASPELYDHRNDPEEFRNIAENSRQQHRVQKMMSELRDWNKQDAVPVQPRVRDLRRAESKQ